jgi:hypothetical protein
MGWSGSAIPYENRIIPIQFGMDRRPGMDLEWNRSGKLGVDNLE